jgi:hypothetical protein
VTWTEMLEEADGRMMSNRDKVMGIRGLYSGGGMTCHHPIREYREGKMRKELGVRVGANRAKMVLCLTAPSQFQRASRYSCPLSTRSLSLFSLSAPSPSNPKLPDPGSKLPDPGS